MINVVNALPQVPAPALAAPIVTYLGGYRVLYLVVAVIGVAEAVLVGRIPGVDCPGAVTVTGLRRPGPSRRSGKLAGSRAPGGSAGWT